MRISCLILFLFFVSSASPLSAQSPPKIPDLEEVRRGNIEEMDLDLALSKLFQTLNDNDDDDLRTTILNGILLGLKGQRNIVPPDEWYRVKHSLSSSHSQKVRNHVLQLSQIFGDEEANKRALATLENERESIVTRKQALASLVAQQHKGLLPALDKLLDSPGLRIEAIRAYSTYNSEAAPKILLGRYPNFNAEEKRAIIETLATRKPYAETLSGRSRKRLDRSIRNPRLC